MMIATPRRGLSPEFLADLELWAKINIELDKDTSEPVFESLVE